jgi:hypothetical protein
MSLTKLSLAGNNFYSVQGKYTSVECLNQNYYQWCDLAVFIFLSPVRIRPATELAIMGGGGRSEGIFLPMILMSPEEWSFS